MSLPELTRRAKRVSMPDLPAIECRQRGASISGRRGASDSGRAGEAVECGRRGASVSGSG